MNNIQTRGHRALNLKDFNGSNLPERIGSLNLALPNERQYVLRMLIKRPFEEMQVPDELKWCQPMIDVCLKAQEERGIRHPFLYITVRHGEVTTKTDDAWHVDGFSQTVTHLPEQNYIWCSHSPTEVAIQPIHFPSDFDSNRHNIHDFFSHVLNDDTPILKVNSKTVYAMDPYVIHRRPKVKEGMVRCFIRLSFTPIEINDINNAQNHNLPTNYKRDGRVDFRDKLVSYHSERMLTLIKGCKEITEVLSNPRLLNITKDYLIGELCVIADELAVLTETKKINLENK